MSKIAKKYPEEFKRHAVDLVRSGRPVPQVSAELEVNRNTLYGWIANHKEEQSVVTDESYAEMKAENRALKKQVAKLEEERTILKKAAAYFAQENV